MRRKETHLEFVTCIQHDRILGAVLQFSNLGLDTRVARDTLAALRAVCASAGPPFIEMGMDVVRVQERYVLSSLCQLQAVLDPLAIRT